MTTPDPNGTPRSRPTYGLPGPQQPAPHEPAAPGYQGPASQEPAPPASAEDPFAIPRTLTFAPGSPGYTPVPEPRKRRGLAPLIVGIFLLVVFGPLFAIGGILIGSAQIGEQAVSGPATLGTEDTMDLESWEMVTVYIPQTDVDAGAGCTAEADDPSQIQQVPSSSQVQFPDGMYVQTLGIMATGDTAVTITCEGTDAAAFLGPFSVAKMMGFMIGGPILGLLTGTIGLVLLVIGIVLLVRSRRPRV